MNTKIVIFLAVNVTAIVIFAVILIYHFSLGETDQSDLSNVTTRRTTRKIYITATPTQSWMSSNRDQETTKAMVTSTLTSLSSSTTLSTSPLTISRIQNIPGKRPPQKEAKFTASFII